MSDSAAMAEGIRRPIDDASARGFLNLRDVGGLATADGGCVALGRLYRSDAPIVGDPVPPLRPWPPRTVVDLRSPGEAVSGPHPLISSGAQVVNIPLFPALDPGRMAAGDAGVVDLPRTYRTLLRSAAPNVVRVVGVVAEGAWPLLVHCAAGKDRTGVATAVVLAAVGVRPEAIVADYLRTQDSLAELPQRLARGWAEEHRDAALRRITVERPELMSAPAAAIEAVLEALDAWPGQAAGWLVDHGLSPDALEDLRRGLVVAAAP